MKFFDLRLVWRGLGKAAQIAAMAACTAALVGCGGGGSGASDSVAIPTAAITSQPSDLSVQEGAPASFTVTATNAESYQWQRQSSGQWSDIAGSQASRLTLPVTALVDHGAQFRVVVVGKANTVTSSAATLSITPQARPVQITVAPVGVNRFVGESASFSVTASGTDPVYKWQRSVGNGSWTDIPGGTLATLNLPPLTLNDHGTQIRVVVSNALGSVTSEAVLLVVEQAGAAPGFTAQPTDLSVEIGQAASFSIVAVGRPQPALRWQQSRNGGSSWSDIDGATQASYTLGTPTLDDDGLQLRVIASNPSGSATSALAKLQVRAKAMAPVVLTQPQDLSVKLRAEAQFTLTHSGSPTPTVQWQQCVGDGCTWANITGATNLSYTLSGVRLEDNGRQYRAVLSNAVGTVTTRAATLSVDARVSLALLYGEIPTDGHRNGALLEAQFASNPDFRILKDHDGNLLVLDSIAHVIRKIDLVRGQVSTIAGQAFERGSEDGDRSTARLDLTSAFPFPILGTDAVGNVYITELGGKRLRKLSTDGRLSTVPISGHIQDPQKGSVSFLLGRATGDAAGNVYVGGWGVIFKIDPAGVVTRLAGKLAEEGSQDGVGADARFKSTELLTMVDGALVVGETDRLRKISLQGEVTTVLGTSMDKPEVRRLFYAQADDGRFYSSGLAYPGIFLGDTLIAGQPNRSRTALEINFRTLALDKTGAMHLVAASDRIERLEQNGSRTALNIKPTPVDKVDVSFVDVAFRGAELLTLECALNGPVVWFNTTCTFAVFSHDSLGNSRQLSDRKIELGRFVPSANGQIVVNAENSSVLQLQGDGSWKVLRQPSSLNWWADRARAVDAEGNTYRVSETSVYKTTPDGQTTVFAGHESQSGHVDGTASNARFSGIDAVTIDSAGALYLKDNHTIRRIAASGEVTTVLGKRGEPFMRLAEEPRLTSNKMLGGDGWILEIGGNDELIIADSRMVLSATIPGVRCDCGPRALRSNAARLRR